MTKLVLEAGLEAEMTSHLGYDNHAVEVIPAVTLSSPGRPARESMR